MSPNPLPKDGDEDPPEELDIEVVPEKDEREFYWTNDPDEIRRFYILVHMADADINANILVENMDRVYKWCKSGELPEKPKPRLSKVHDKTD